MVSRMKIKFGEELGTMYFIQEIINDWDRKFIIEGQIIEGLRVWIHVTNSFFL